MKIALFSNFLNHHQLPLCQEIAARDDVEFKFVACEKISDDRLSMGYADMNRQYPFVLRAYEDPDEAVSIAETYDAVIFGASPLEYLKLRMEKGLLSFRFAERSLKKGTWRRFIPTTRMKISEGYTKYKDNALYVLCASAYTSYDLSLCGFPASKCFKWGYFPDVEQRDTDALLSLKRANAVPEILYAGRLLKLKHVMDMVKAVHNLVKDGIKAHFTVIGDGETRSDIEAYIAKNSLKEHITMLPFMSPDAVREYMDRSDIYIFGSDFREGWGAVVNESMNSACALVVSHAVGSAAYLIDSGKNGFVYESGSVRDLESKLRSLLDDALLREEMGLNAYKTMSESWSAKVASERLVALCEGLLRKADIPSFSSGPCSPAGIIKNNWIKVK